MAAIDRASTILDALADKTLTAQQKQNIAEKFIGYNEAYTTNEEKAQAFLDKLLNYMKAHCRHQASEKVLRDQQSAQMQAVADASADFE